MHDIPREKLAEIIRMYGQVVSEDPRRVEALLRDLCPQHTKEINLIVGAARQQVPSDLLSASSTQPFGLLAGRLRRHLSDELAITEKAAQWTVECWALALGKVQPSQLSGAAAKAHLEAGNTLVDQEQFAQAAAAYQEAIRLDPEYTEAYNNLGIALAEQSHMAQAADAFREAVRLDPQDAESQSNFGNALLHLGQVAAGVEHLHEALRLDPNMPDVHESLERAKMSSSRLEALSETKVISPVSEPARSLPSSALQGASSKGLILSRYRPLVLIAIALFAAFMVYQMKSASVQPAPAVVTATEPTATSVPVAAVPEDTSRNLSAVESKTPGSVTTSDTPSSDSNTSSSSLPAADTAESLGAPVSDFHMSSSSASARDTMTAYAPEGSGLSDDPISADSLQSERLSAEDLQGKSLRSLSISHNTIFARHGCTFDRESVRSYFEAQPWYHPDPAFTTAMLSPLEQRNVETIRAAEHAQFGYGPPVSAGLGSGREPLAETAPTGSGLSDRVLRLSILQNSRVTDSDLNGRSLAALSISYNAIYAAHGYVFQRKSLQRLFGQMSWYHQNPAFAESDLTETEKANLKTIRAYERIRFGY